MKDLCINNGHFVTALLLLSELFIALFSESKQECIIIRMSFWKFIRAFQSCIASTRVPARRVLDYFSLKS